MRKWLKWKQLQWWIVGCCVLGCSSESLNGPVSVKVIRPVAGRMCQYTVEAAPLTTLTSLRRMTGSLGSVVYTKENLNSRPEILDSGDTFSAVDTQFSSSNGVHGPLDLDSLYAASLYYAVETAYLTMSRLEAKADLVRNVPGFGENTRIVHEARRTFGEVGRDPEVTDNAEYLSHKVNRGGTEVTLNYIISYPTLDVTDIPLGLNLGIMAHEYTHLVMHHLFYVPGIARNLGVASGKPTSNTLAALDEGLADYFGFLASGDPSYFLCSYPNEDRDLLKPKSFSDSAITRIAGSGYFDSHEGGAIFAAINYEIGKVIGFEENGKLLLRLMSYLLDCPDTQSGSSSLSMDFKSVAACHARLGSSSQQATIRQIYNARLGSYGGI